MKKDKSNINEQVPGRETKKEETAAKYYDISQKAQAIDDLANADISETPEYSKEELNKYRSHRSFKLSEALKIIALKAWFAGVVCFFILWGLGTYVTAELDMLFITALALGLVTDLLLNNLIRFMEETPGANDRWMMFPKKGMLSFLLNLLYGFVLLFCVYMLYNLINFTINSITGDMEAVPLGVEPILFGVFTMAFDMLFIWIKHLIQRLIHRVGSGKSKRESAQ